MIPGGSMITNRVRKRDPKTATSNTVSLAREERALRRGRGVRAAAAAVAGTRRYAQGRAGSWRRGAVEEGARGLSGRDPPDTR
ncbi:hypothetical protein GCM10010342_13950 [Streptomyces anulatus]|nr:hypothetical protein GCM10010342_13950 [Streptomyces anulatus]